MINLYLRRSDDPEMMELWAEDDRRNLWMLLTVLNEDVILEKIYPSYNYNIDAIIQNQEMIPLEISINFSKLQQTA